MNDLQLADELVKLAALIRLRQTDLHPRTRYLLIASLADHQQEQFDKLSMGPDPQARVHASMFHPEARFIDFQQTPDDRVRRTHHNKAKHYGGPVRAYDPEYHLTLRIHGDRADTHPNIILPLPSDRP